MRPLYLSGTLAVFALTLSAQTAPHFNWQLEVDGSGPNTFTGLGTDALGNTYVAGSTQSTSFAVQAAAQAHSAGNFDVYVTKIDPSGNVVYSTYFGGSGADMATAMTVDAKGNVYVTGTTTSLDFPVTPGVYGTTLPDVSTQGRYTGPLVVSFAFKLNANGTVAYSTYLSNSASTPDAIAVDSGGSVYVTGVTQGGLVTTPGAYQSVCNCGITSNGFFGVPYSDSFLIRLDAAASKPVFSTYLNIAGFANTASATAVAVAPDGSAYVAAPSGVYRFDAAGSALLASSSALGAAGNLSLPHTLAIAPDGTVYLAGNAPSQFKPTSGAFQTTTPPSPQLPSQGNGIYSGIVRFDPALTHVLSATWFNGNYGNTIWALAPDSAGNIYFGGYTSPRSLPTLAPFFQGFGYAVPTYGTLSTGFLVKMSGDLSTLLFSTNLGDNEEFGVTGIGVAPDGAVRIGGVTAGGAGIARSPGPTNVWVNSISAGSGLPTLRIDSVQNAASHTSDPLSPGETILIVGSGFGGDSQLWIDDVSARIVSVTANAIVAIAPGAFASPFASIHVLNGFTATPGQRSSAIPISGAASNTVVVATNTYSPGLFSSDGTGTGQGVILNQDGSLNSPSNPAKPGDRITIFATGVGPVSFTNGYAVTQVTPAVYLDGFYCAGVAAVVGPVAGPPGSVYQLTVYVPDYASLIANNPDLKTFRFPAQSGIILRINGASSQDGLAISIQP